MKENVSFLAHLAEFHGIFVNLHRKLARRRHDESDGACIVEAFTHGKMGMKHDVRGKHVILKLCVMVPNLR